MLSLDRLENNHWWYQSRKRILLDLVQKIPKERSVLDLGSATGGNTEMMLNLGLKVTSVEYSQIGVDIQRSKGIKVDQGDARNLVYKDSSFFAVVCLDVLEHIVDDKQVLAEIFRVLQPGGFAVISVPQDPNLWSDHDRAVRHVRRYERADLVNKIQSTGFQEIEIFNSVVLLKPLIGFYRRRHQGSSLKDLSSTVNWILLQVQKIEQISFFRKRSGVTLWAVIRKPI